MIEIRKGSFTVKADEGSWKIYEGAVLRAHGECSTWYAAKKGIIDNLRALKADKGLIFEVSWRPSEREIREAIAKLPAAPENELLPYQVEIGYNATGCKAVDGTWIRKEANGVYEARMPLMLFGMAGDGCPFDDRFNGPVACGRGASREVAIRLAILEAAREGAAIWS